MQKRTRRCIGTGVVFALPYMMIWVLGVLSRLFNPHSDAQIFIAFTALPSSIWLGSALIWLDTQGSTVRQIADALCLDWLFLLLAGVGQYFALGYALARFLYFLWDLDEFFGLR